jgi:hypothetical protein
MKKLSRRELAHKAAGLAAAPASPALGQLAAGSAYIGPLTGVDHIRRVGEGSYRANVANARRREER